MKKRVAIVGAGPAGLMAADIISSQGYDVHVYDQMPTAGRKFLMAGKSGLNISHSEAEDIFNTRFGANPSPLLTALKSMNSDAVTQWAHALDQETFVGSSGRIFPKVMKAAPLLRAWLSRLSSQGVTLHTRHRWVGWSENDCLIFDHLEKRIMVSADATVLALGGGSWARLGSDGKWVETLQNSAIEVSPLKPANMGFAIDWPKNFLSQHAGTPVKGVALRSGNASVEGDFVITEHGIEGGAVYQISASLREALCSNSQMPLTLDILPRRSLTDIEKALSTGRGKNSFSNHLRKRTHLTGIKAALLKQSTPKTVMSDPAALAAAIKALPIPVLSSRPIDEAISVAGGVAFEGLDEYFMHTRKSGLFFAGEMLDWEAPTGGYLITACLATGKKAGDGVVKYLEQASL